MNTENTLEKENPIRRYALQKINLYIGEARQQGKTEDEIEELIRQFHACTNDLVRQFDYQKEMIEQARIEREKEQNENPMNFGRGSI